MKIKDIKGQKFNRLTVIEFVEVRGKSGHSYWKTLCECGKTKIVRASHLKTNSVRSCGCYASEVNSKKLKEYANSDRHKGKGNPMWKGDKAKHAAMHTWLNAHYKKEKCEKCDSKRFLDWALISGKKHSHNVKHYKVLCRSCHHRYDYKSGVRNNQYTKALVQKLSSN